MEIVRYSFPPENTLPKKIRHDFSYLGKCIILLKPSHNFELQSGHQQLGTRWLSSRDCGAGDRAETLKKLKKYKCPAHLHPPSLEGWEEKTTEAVTLKKIKTKTKTKPIPGNLTYTHKHLSPLNKCGTMMLSQSLVNDNSLLQKRKKIRT